MKVMRLLIQLFPDYKCRLDKKTKTVVSSNFANNITDMSSMYWRRTPLNDMPLNITLQAQDSRIKILFWYVVLLG